MAGSGARVGIFIVAIAEGRSSIEEQAEATLTELVAITFKVVATELVDDDDDNQAGMTVVGRSEGSLLLQKAQQGADDQARRAVSKTSSHCVDSVQAAFMG